MFQKNKLNKIIYSLLDFLNEDILLNKLINTDLEDKICFDCKLWNEGLTYCSDDIQIKIHPVKSHFLKLLNNIQCFIKNELCNYDNNDYDYKSQIDRFLCVITDIKNKVASIICTNSCSNIHILSVLLTTLIQTILNLVTTLENLNTIFCTYSSKHSCFCVNSNTFKIFMGLFINSITKLQTLLRDWYVVTVTFLSLSTPSPKSYVASYVPKSYIYNPISPSPLKHICAYDSSCDLHNICT